MDEFDILCLNDIMREKINEEIEDLRYNAGRKIPLAEIAEDMGISHRYLADILHKRTNITFDKIIRIIDYFDVSFEWLIGRDEHRKPVLQQSELNYGLREKSIENLKKLSRGIVPYDGKPLEYDPPVTGFNAAKKMYIVSSATYFDHEYDPRIRETINASYLTGTIGLLLTDRALLQLIDSYLHSMWADQYIPEDTNTCELDVFIFDEIRRRMNTIRKNWFRTLVNSLPKEGVYRSRGGKFDDDY